MTFLDVVFLLIFLFAFFTESAFIAESCCMGVMTFLCFLDDFLVVSATVAGAGAGVAATAAAGAGVLLAGLACFG